ncbi:bifunctional tRNA (5-methylaminomethyl-2-thiouridine)(34)-methyltransferase MnmD/FAD-dependent 5-carboxymethylaminomethyl-2-thiouridine(34) oxidoreductase MnmC [Vibrio sp. TH_r3]|uniref:bifunctional tRNA (5-methylaminomethyl-2-thiouridine)(34)-methyltransferase MnmD/FAD-dependent 5-carboxymethylaminomethyl-2-thiouridine(34) oxidoreductase MnmC n=1 Tax=Vibrio sp. TH_r3 TaxID=3082084 RepID=UPI0029538096|nr:bifunctional tRNA (5-methylaminomethyl-2-thiouridine)(34)-methyltransferase MnmD/FAD-dependent 5-carboxymethylaminomethyl-2-thiouridine(34) oxidoreductase MnmC [Vibrio sp. TH_r3]MDV7103171.1 bifunctional tRNA (5-methylaminomethyl-2-thiouridine)(34)-methyltransferase MnmD/FAD-dependent 5-carboxymethylaminomethyl-2-thiouridine(34) oxidoreductase MnmC [Vibrio sp. TH_r3]
MTSITNAHLEWNEVGTPVSGQFDDVYFSNASGLEESRYVFIQQNHLPERWQTYDQRRFVIAETGFGTGLNFLAVWQQFENFRAEFPNAPVKELHFISFEKFPLNIDDLVKAHQAWPELASYAKQLQDCYPISVPECHRLIFADGAVTLDLWFGDIKDCMPLVATNSQGIVDTWFLDGFAPSKNPEMWNQTLFDNMVKLAKKDCSCATFTAAGFVRRGLIEAGFNMEKVKGFGQKREMLAGKLNFKQPFTNIKPWFARPTNDNVDDVAIIGGGIASAALAATLCRRGVHVTLYCQDEHVAQNASGNKQGALYPLLNRDHSGASRIFAPSLLFARQFFDHSAQHIDFDHDWCGVTHVAWSDKARKQLENILLGNYVKELVTAVDSKEVNQLVGLPTDLDGIHFPLGGWLNPQQFTQNLVDFLVKNQKLTLVTNTEIGQLERQNGCWALSGTNNQTQHDVQFQHKVVVVANGHKANQLSQTANIPQSPVKGQVSHVPTTDSLKKLNTVLCYNGYMTPHNPNTRQHCIGASHDRKNIDFAFDAQAQQENADKLVRTLPDKSWVKEVDITTHQAKQGIRSTSRDHLPFVGNVCDFEAVKHDYATLRDNKDVGTVADYPDLYCFLALGGRGLCSAPLMAEVLASQICNDPLPLPIDSLEHIHPAKIWVRKLLKGRPVSKE